MLGSYGPSPTGEPYIKNFDPEESPSGMLARTGTYNVRSRVVDDDGEVYAGSFFPLNSPYCSLVCLTVYISRLGLEF
jgi:RHO protein GDP dissociation inhibitor